jgi:hypothetical protein
MKVSILLSFLMILCSYGNTFERQIAILVRHNYRGEINFAHRIKSACQHLHWNADILDIQDPEELEKNDYDFVISLVPGAYMHPKCKNYLAIFHPVHHYFNKSGFLRKEYRSYDGYLLTYSPTPTGDKKKCFSNVDRFPHIRWYPTVQRREYKETDPVHLFFICSAWGNRFENEKFQQFLNLLDKEPYTRFYGSPVFQTIYPHSYRGTIPYDGESLCEAAAQAGVCLVLHSSDHNAYGLPSGRIFEAAAASTVIISDENAFVREHFKDAVLYVDTNQDSLSIFKQIQNHMDWIRTNKDEALQKAKRANAIYQEKFLLEDQLLQLAQFHDRLSNESKLLGWKWLQIIGASEL